MKSFNKEFLRALKTLKSNFFGGISLVIFLLFAFILIFSSEYLFKSGFSDNYELYLLTAKLIAFLVFLSPLHYGIFLWFNESQLGFKHAVWESLGFFTSLRLIFRSAFHRLTFILMYMLCLSPTFILLCLGWASIKIAIINAQTEFLILGFCFFMVFIPFCILTLIFLSRFSLSTYIFVTNPDISVLSSFILSYKATKGKSVFLYKCKTRLFLINALTLFMIPISISVDYLTMSSLCSKIYSDSAVKIH